NTRAAPPAATPTTPPPMCRTSAVWAAARSRRGASGLRWMIIGLPPSELQRRAADDHLREDGEADDPDAHQDGQRQQAAGHGEARARVGALLGAQVEFQHGERDEVAAPGPSLQHRVAEAHLVPEPAAEDQVAE